MAPVVSKDTFCYYEAAGQGLVFAFFDNAGEHALEVGHIVVLVPAHCASGNLDTLSDRIVDAPICNYYVPSLTEGRYHAADC